VLGVLLNMLTRTENILAILTSVTAFAGSASAQARSDAPRVWSVTVLGDSSDPRFRAVQEATQYWNRELEAVGSRLRFGPVTSSSQEPIGEQILEALSDAVQARSRRLQQPAGFRRIDGDVVVALSSSPSLRSIGISPERFGGKGLVVLRPAHIPPLSLPNVARNVAAHELGHVLGLPHNSQPGTLMCMPPAPCRPLNYQADTVAFFPLTETERRFLRGRTEQGRNDPPQ
jgi:matrixin